MNGRFESHLKVVDTYHMMKEIRYEGQEITACCSERCEHLRIVAIPWLDTPKVNKEINMQLGSFIVLLWCLLISILHILKVASMS